MFRLPDSYQVKGHADYPSFITVKGTMVYMPGKRKELFAIKDPEMETKEIGFVNRKAMIGIGAVLGIIVGGVFIYFSGWWLIGIPVGLLIGGITAWAPVYSDKKREKYYSPLIETIKDRLEKNGYEVTRRQIMDLLYLRDLRVSDEDVLIAHTEKKQLSIMVCHHKKPERIKPKKKKFFETLVVGEPVVEDDSLEPETVDTVGEVSPAETPVEEVSPAEAPVEEVSPAEDMVEEPSPAEDMVEEVSPAEVTVEEPSPAEDMVEEVSPEHHTADDEDIIDPVTELSSEEDIEELQDNQPENR